MNCLDKIKLDIAKLINKVLKKDFVFNTDFTYPRDKKMGDLSLACFGLSRDLKKSPADIAQFLKNDFPALRVIQDVSNTGAYLNFALNQKEIASQVIKKIIKENSEYGKFSIGKKQNIMVEFAHPNTHKAFHIGHLRTAIIGESVARILEALGYKITRANYQGDVGPHVAKCIWGVQKLKDEYIKINQKNIAINKKVEFLGKAYVLGSKNYEEDIKAKQEIIKLNKAIYEKDKNIIELYKITRAWSLEYFDTIYKKLKTGFDKFYFESEVFEEGKNIVLKNLGKNIFKKSDGAVIFKGSKHGLHDRVFINSEGFPTYEAKELGLAYLQINCKQQPKKIIHVVANEQSEYFKVVFKALEQILPKSKNIEEHLSYAMVDLKNGKMSSRQGNVVLGEWLLDQVEDKICTLMEQSSASNKIRKDVVDNISLGAVKYFILKNGINTKILFDIQESVNLSGNSGPYLQYTYVRTLSIFKKSKLKMKNLKIDFFNLNEPQEHQLVMQLAKYPEVVLSAGKNYDPSEIAKYLFELCKLFNDYYHVVSILKSEEKIKNVRLVLSWSVSQVIQNGLNLLGIDTVEEM